jgi:hypothetical protein
MNGRKISTAPKPQFIERGPMECLGGFGTSAPVTQDSLYCQPKSMKSKKKGRKGGSGGGTGSVTTKKELGIRVTDYFNYTTEDSSAGGIPQFVSNYYWDIGQNLFQNSTVPGGQENTFCRVRKVDVWVLPICRTFGAPGTNNAQSAFTVNCQTPGMGQQFNATNPLVNVAFATDTQVTNVLPRIDTKWKKCFSCDFQKTFQSGSIRPVFVPSLPTNQCIFQMSIVNQTDGKPYLSGDDQAPIRVKVQLTLDQPIATTQNASLAVWRNEEFSLPYVEQNGIAYPGTTDQYVQMDLSSVRDNMR